MSHITVSMDGLDRTILKIPGDNEMNVNSSCQVERISTLTWIPFRNVTYKVQ